jgi:LuxR family maltose regulon positive regulatory protein
MDGQELVSFGTLLKRYRVAAGLSQEALAERARMSARGISDLERGLRQTPYRDTIDQLAFALNLDGPERAALEQAARRVRVVRSPPARTRREHQADALVTTKLAIPAARASLVARPHLVDRLQAGLEGPLTLLTAPAGSGKTTLLSAWRASRGRDMPLAWVALDASDNDLVQFWRYVLNALDLVRPGVSSDALALLRSPEPVPIEVVLAQLINSLSAPGEDAVLVLDDYHLIEVEAIHRGLAFLLDHLPPSLHLVISTRADPPLQLARLRANGLVMEIRANDLRFTVDEAAAFLTEVMSLELTADDVAALEARTEGWIAGLQLAALSLQGRSPDELTVFVAAFAGSHRHVADYLGEEVLARQPDDMQQFLLHTSVLDRMCAALCAAVVADDGEQQDDVARCQVRLDELERGNLFVVALDDHREWYRYHHLFAELLRHRLLSHAPEGVPQLHSRASAWFEGQGLLHDAIEHAFSSEDPEHAANLLELALSGLVARGSSGSLWGWLNALPDPIMRDHPRLCVTRGWLLLGRGGNVGRAQGWLDVAYEALEGATQTDEERNLLGSLAAARSFAATLHGDAEAAVRNGEEALTCLRPGSILERGLAGLSLGRAYMAQGDLPRAERTFGDAAVAARAWRSSPFPAVWAMVSQSCAQRGLGMLRRAAATCQQAIEWCTSVDHPSALHAVGIVHVALADLHREWNELDLAMRRVGEGLDLCAPLKDDPIAQVVPLLVMARIQQAQGDRAGAFASVHQAKQLNQTLEGAGYADVLEAYEAQLWLMEENLAAATARADALEETIPQSVELSAFLFNYRKEHLDIAPIQVLIARGRAAGDTACLNMALDLLEKSCPDWDRGRPSWLQIKTLVLQALAHHALGNVANAVSAAEQAIARAQPEGYIRVFADEGPVLADVLRQVPICSAYHDYVTALLAVLDGCRNGGIPAAECPGNSGFPGPPLTEPLSSRELEVLRLLTVGQSNPDIARSLYVEVNTVKTHIRNLYGKLGVHNRMQAVQRARELRLI